MSIDKSRFAVQAVTFDSGSQQEEDKWPSRERTEFNDKDTEISL